MNRSTRPTRDQIGSSARRLRTRARQAIAGSTPTTPIALRASDSERDDTYTRMVIDLALRVGEALLATGASAADTTSSVLRLTKAYGVSSVHVDITFSSITISHHRGIYRDPITVMRIVAVMQQDFTRLERLQELVRDAESKDLSLVDAGELLDEIVRAPHPYSRRVVAAASMLMGAAVAALLGGGLVVMILSALTTAVVERTVRWLGARAVPGFFRQAVGGAIPTVVAITLSTIGTRLHIGFVQHIQPSLIVASGVVVLLAGFAAVGAAQDTLDGFYVTASGRTFEVLLLSGGVVAGVLGVLAIAQHLGAVLRISTNVSWNTSIVGILAGSVIALASAVTSYARPRTIVSAAVVGGLAWTAYSLCVNYRLSAVVGAAAGALLVGVLATLIGFRLHVPSLALATAGIVPLLPGMTIYRGVFELVDRQGNASSGISTLLGAGLVGLAIASGVTLGSFPGRNRRHATISRKRVVQTEA